MVTTLAVAWASVCLLATARPVTISGDNVKPFILARPGGGAYLTWASPTGVVFAGSPTGGDFGPPTTVSRAGMALDLGAESGPQMAVGPDRAIHIVWIAGTKPAELPAKGRPRPGNLTVYLSTSRDEGRSFSGPVKVNDDTGGAEHRFATVAVAASGVITVAWLDKRGQSEQRPDFARVYTAHSTDGGRSFSRNRDATQGQKHGICHCCKIALACSPRAGVEIGFRNAVNDTRDISLVHSITDRHFSDPVDLEATGWVFPGCPMNGPSLAFDQADRLHAVWLTGGKVPGAPVIGKLATDSHKILYRVRQPGKRRWSAPVFLACGTHPRLAVAANGTAYVVWETDGIQLARLPTRDRPGIETWSLTDAETRAVFPSVAIAPAGQVHVAWQQWDATGQSQIWTTMLSHP